MNQIYFHSAKKKRIRGLFGQEYTVLYKLQQSEVSYNDVSWLQNHVPKYYTLSYQKNECF